jgi:hypothetical protein
MASLAVRPAEPLDLGPPLLVGQPSLAGGASRAAAASRFRSWERFSDAVTVITPPDILPSSARRARSFSGGGSASDPARS